MDETTAGVSLSWIVAGAAVGAAFLIACGLSYAHHTARAHKPAPVARAAPALPVEPVAY